MYGARPSLIVAFTATLFGTVVGVVMGLLAGFLGGWVDRVISWVIDFVLSLPYLLFAIAMVPIVESLARRFVQPLAGATGLDEVLRTDLRAVVLRLGRTGAHHPR